MDPNDSDAISNMWTSKLTDVLGALDYVRVSEQCMLKCCCFFSWLPWQLEFCVERNSLNSFERGPLKDLSSEVW